MSESSPVWESVGRGSPAGRALYNLFSEDINGRQTGDKFSARNKAVFEAKIAMGWKPNSPGKQGKAKSPAKAEVRVPKFGQRSPPAVPAQPSGRKPANLILRDLSERQRELEEARPPPPSGPLLDDAEKERLAEWMRYRGKPPERKAIVQHLKPQVVKGSKAELQKLFDEIVVEINERQAFLEEMAALSQTSGKAYQTQSNQIKREIAERVKEMKRIDKMLHN